MEIRYKIEWFNSSKQRVETKFFEGENAYDEAEEWAKANLENWYKDGVIQSC